MEGWQGQVGGIRALLGEFGGILRVFWGGIFIGVCIPAFSISVVGYRAGCGVSCALWGGKGAPIGGQKVLGAGLRGARRGVKGKLGGSGLYSANLGAFYGF